MAERTSVAVVARIVGDADLGVVAVVMREDVVGESLGGHPDGVPVHPVGSDPHDATKSTGAEFEVLSECVLQLRLVAAEHLADLHLGFLVEIAFEP